MFDLPADFVASSTAYIGELATDLAGPLALIFGIALAMWVINYVLSLVRKRARA